MDLLIGFFTSKTTWFNTAAVVIAFLTEGLADLGLPPELYAVAVSVGNYILRILTRESLEDKGARLSPPGL